MSAKARGTSSATMRVAVCKDCQREIAHLRRRIEEAQKKNNRKEVTRLERELEKRDHATFTYSEFAATGVLDRGGSRSDRCPEHRRAHRGNTQGMAVAYVDLATIGVALGADSPDGPAGPFGGLGPLPTNHEVDTRSADLSQFEFGMSDEDVVKILEILRHKRVLVLRAGTGTGKSTFAPFRLMDPPSIADLERLGLKDKLAKAGINLPDGPYRLIERGPIVVTEPRVAAAAGVAQFVGEKLAMGCTLKQCSNAAHGTFNPKAHPDGPDGVLGPSCPDFEHENPARRCTRDHVGKHPGVGSGEKLPRGCEVSDCSSHIGPGYPVGYHAGGVRNWDDACQLVYATDGAVINWLRDGRLSRIGTVIVDEAHERSTNIDFILGYLKRDLAKYPHLRVIITSATFDPEFYQEYFGRDVAEVMNVPAVKSVGYGMPLFPELDTNTPDMVTYLANGGEWREPWRLESREESDDERAERVIRAHWPPTKDDDGNEHRNDRGEPVALAPALKETEVLDPEDVGDREDLHDTTRRLLLLRLPEHKVPKDRWKEQMPDLLAEFIIDLVRGLDEKPEIFGDVLAFLPTGRTITATCDKISAALGARADVCPLLSSLDQDKVDRALNARKKGDKRKVVISTNLAETSLTVEGVRFVVDTGLIAQSSWDTDRASGNVGTTEHSRSGVKQRWGRVGRKAPGWVFPLYTKAQYAGLASDTPPGSVRENLEALMMTARMGGVDDVVTFPWPAAFLPETAKPDKAATDVRDKFVAERDRADAALRSNGAVNHDGHPTTFGKELVRFSGMGSTASAMAVLYADRLACVPEVLTILGLLEDARLISQSGLLHDEYAWPDEWRVEAAARHRGLASLAEDDAHLALLITAAWERVDPGTDPWEPSSERQAWARQWWINDRVLREMAAKRKTVLTALSPGMKKPVRRPVEPALLDRARGVLGRTSKMFEFELDGDAYVPVLVPPTRDDEPHEPLRFLVENDSVLKAQPERILALRRREDRGGVSRLSNIVALPSANSVSADARPESSVADAMSMLLEFKERAAPDHRRGIALRLIDEWPIGQRRLLHGTDASETMERLAPFARPRTGEEGEQDGVAPRRRRTTRKQRRFDDDGEPIDAELADTATELPGKARGIDEDRLAASELRRAGRALDQHACGTCDECLAGRFDDCRARPEPLPNPKDALRAWSQASVDVLSNAMGSLALAFPQGTPTAGEPAWFEVVGYELGDSPTIVLAPDWRAADADPDPARHPDDDPGDAVVVSIGNTIEDHSGFVRVFNCVNRRDRFLLREAHHRAAVQTERGQIAASLDLTHQGLLQDLKPGGIITATVVPGRAPDTVTITLLEHLRQHLDSSPTIPDPHNRKSPRSFHPAVVESTVNEFGRWSVRLLSQDTTLGLHHIFHLRTQRNAEAQEDGTVEESEPAHEAKLKTGQPLAICFDHVGQSRSSLRKLNVGGLDLDKLGTIVEESLTTLKLKGIDPDRADERDLDGDDEAVDADDLSDELTRTVRPAPATAWIELRGDKPLSRGSAVALAELDGADAWQRRVWTFWARTHHLLVAEEDPFVDSEPREPIEHHIETKISTEKPIEVGRAELAEFAARTPLGSTLQAAVTRLQAKHYDVELDGGLAAILPYNEVTWDSRLDPATVLAIGEPHLVMLHAAVDLSGTKRPVVSLKQLQPDPLPAYMGRFPVGTTVSGIVWQVDEKKARLDLAPGVVGLLTIGDLSHREVASVGEVLKEEDRIEVSVRELLRGQRMVRVSRKAVLPHPYVEYKARHKVGDRVEGVVDWVSKSQVTVRHSNGAIGVVGKPHLRWEAVEDAKLLYKKGAYVEARILDFDDGKRELKLSIRDLLPEPYVEYKARHKVGDRVEGVVDWVSKSQVTVRHSNGAIGVVGKPHLRWEAVDDAKLLYKKGDRVKARILDFDDGKRELKLSIRDLLPEPLTAFMNSHEIGRTVRGVVTKILPKSAAVDLGGGVRGSIYIRNVTGARLNSFDGHLEPGQRYDFRVLGYDQDRKHVNLARFGLAR
jgi:HrpA-like RNA helicase/ribosomal protein S1